MIPVEPTAEHPMPFDMDDEQPKTHKDAVAVAANTVDLIEQLGRELVMTRPTCATLALGTLKKGVHEYAMHKKAENTTYR